jgi:2-keto-4-pentenoate hydratase/2-oxohepta-3-ene-1,7-dioic acid hydratase in catechol pathway
MRLVSFRVGKDAGAPPRFGALVADAVVDLVEAFRAAGLATPTEAQDAVAWLDLDGPFLAGARQVVDELTSDEKTRTRLEQRGAVLALDGVRLTAPIPRPGKILCIGLNYRDHAEETGKPIPERPILFSKFPTAVVGPNDPVILPRISTKVDFEAELGVVLGRRAKHVPRERALEHVLGYVNLNDVSARDLQYGDGQWQRGKSCDTFAPMGPAIVTADEVADPGALGIRLRLNGAVMQESNTSRLIFGVPDLIAFLSQTITLEPGDVLATGTPAGVGFARQPPVFLKPGDQLEVEIDGLGLLANPVVAEGD